MRFSDTLRDAAPEWTAMQAHRFVRAIEDDRLPDAALRRYLVIECGFVDAAVAVFAHALADAPTAEARATLGGIIGGLTRDQMGFFDEAFAALGVDGEPWRAPPPPEAAMLRWGMLGFAAHGGYRDAVTAMLAAEWTYLTFCERALEKTVSNPILRRWLTLHVEAPFRAQAAWLRAEVDALGGRADETGREHMLSVFRTALALEIGFHDAPFE